MLHFVVPAPYRAIVPAPLRGHDSAVVAASGACELLCATLMVFPLTRRVGASATVLLLVAVFPANLQMALDSGRGKGAFLTWLRLPLQVPLVLWALHVRHNAVRGGRRAE